MVENFVTDSTAKQYAIESVKFSNSVDSAMSSEFL